jgi:hypothetical protein
MIKRYLSESLGCARSAEADSPRASLVSAAASTSASSEPVLIHRYYFRAVANRGTNGKAAAGFGFAAYPAGYRSSGGRWEGSQRDGMGALRPQVEVESCS